MASRKSRSNAPSAPTGKSRLAGFEAYVEALANGQTCASDPALASALNKPGVMRSSGAWKAFAQQVAQDSAQRGAAPRVLPPWQVLRPLP